MKKLTKKNKEVGKLLQANHAYSLEEAASLVKKINCTSFDSSVDVHVRLAVDPTKPDQALRSTVSLPHGSGKTKKVLVLCSSDKEEQAKKAGADHVGLDEYIQKIEKGWTDVDVVIATPNVMAKIGKIGKILGPRNLMPNPKVGTVTDDVAGAVRDVKAGKIAFKVDKAGIVHCPIGRVSFDAKKIRENVSELVKTLNELRPISVKGVYMKTLYLVTSMSPSVLVDLKSLTSFSNH